MEEQIQLIEDSPHVDTTKEKFIKFIVVTAVGYIATQTAEHVVDRFLQSRRSR